MWPQEVYRRTRPDGNLTAMGAKTRVRYGAALAAAAATVTAIAGVAACDPVDGLNSASVAYTTDRTGTSALEHHGVAVQWLTCTADVGNGKTSSPSASARSVAHVDCQGRTKDHKAITIKGTVTKSVDGRCVRGHLTSHLGHQLAFRATLLGNCASPAATSRGNPSGQDDGGGARPTVTVTETVTRTPGK